MRTVRMLDLPAEYRLFSREIRDAVEAVLTSQRFIGGPVISDLESALAKRFGVAHVVAVSNGTDALLVALMALGVGQGDEVIVPSFTFFATAGSVWRVGARPVFVDIDERTFNLDPAKVEAAISPRTRAIMPVHLFGQCADMEAIGAIARRHKLAVIEDAAQAIGATAAGRFAGTMGDLGCFSFYPTKNLGGFGEGGAVFTHRDDLGRVVRQLRTHGESDRYVHERVGGNFRLDTMKAAILLIKLARLDEFTRRRRANAARYDALLKSVVTTPYVATGCEHVYHQYSILCERRDGLRSFLHDRGVETGVYYPVPLHLQKCFASLGYGRGSLPVTERTCERIVSLPCHPMLTEEDVQYLAECVREFSIANSD
jgi:dTDP-4-amino-4,6-dideoxygalactose transaminase